MPLCPSTKTSRAPAAADARAAYMAGAGAAKDQLEEIDRNSSGARGPHERNYPRIRWRARR
jgi:hypothetical protein